METHAIPGARFVDPKVLARIKDLELLARNGRRRLHQRPAPRAVLRRVDRLRRAPRLRAGRRHPARGLAAVRAHGPVLRQAVRGGHQRQLLGARSTCRSRWASRASGVSKLEYGVVPGRVPRRTSRTGSATASASSRSTRTSSTYVPPSAKHFNVLLHTLDRVEGRAARAGCSTVLDKMAEHFKRRSIVALISDLYENPDDLLEALKPYRFLGQRPRRVSRARPGRDRLPVHGGVAVRGPRERRGSARRARVVRRAVPQDDAASTSRRSRRSARRRASTTCCSTRRSRSTRRCSLPGQPRAVDAGAVSRCRFSRRCSSPGLAAIAVPILVHLIQRERKDVIEFPSLMFIRRIPYQSVERRRIHNWLLLAAARRRRWRCSCAAFSRPFFTQDPRQGRGGDDRRARGGRSCSIGRRAWATAITGRARRPRRGRSSATLGGDDRGDARAVRARHRRGRARDVRSRPARGRDQRGRRCRPTRRATRPALRLAQSLLSQSHAAAQGGVPHQRLPEDRLGAAGRDPPARGRDAHAGVGRRRSRRPNLSVTSVAFQRASFSGEERVTSRPA